MISTDCSDEMSNALFEEFGENLLDSESKNREGKYLTISSMGFSVLGMIINVVDLF